MSDEVKKLEQRADEQRRKKIFDETRWRDEARRHIEEERLREAVAAEASVFRSAKELIAEPSAPFVIDRYAWAQQVGALVSESGAGKTFVALSQAAAISTGESWLGEFPVKRRGSTAYVSYEGDAFGKRLKALKKTGHDVSNIHVMRASHPLTSPVGEAIVKERLAELASRVERPILFVVVDTVRMALEGSEDSSENVSRLIAAVRRLLAPFPEAFGQLVHHSGWQDGDAPKKRERGSSAMRGNVDFTYFLQDLGDGHLLLNGLKTKDDERLRPVRLVRERVDLGFETSCVIRLDDRKAEVIELEDEARQLVAYEAEEKRFLKLISENKVSNQKVMRTLAGGALETAAIVLGRLETRGYLVPSPPRKRGEPYALTPSGVEKANEP